MSLKKTGEEDTLAAYFQVGFLDLKQLFQIRQKKKKAKTKPQPNLYAFLGPRAVSLILRHFCRGRSAFFHSRAAEALSLLALPPTDAV